MIEVRCHWCGGMVGNYTPLGAVFDAPLCCSDECLENYTNEDQ